MYKILIESGVTYLFKDNGMDGINNKELLGFLINEEGIIELINNLPIRKYYVNTMESPYKEINKEKAKFLYEQILIANKENIKTK